MASKVTLQFFDDLTGRNASVSILPNGHEHDLSKLLAETALASGGFVTALQLGAGREGVTAKVNEGEKVIATAVGDGDNYERFERRGLGGLRVVATK